MFVITFREVNHLILHSRRNICCTALSTFDIARCCKSHKTSYCRFRWHNSTIINNAAIFQITFTALLVKHCLSNGVSLLHCSLYKSCLDTYNNGIFTNVDVRSNRCSGYHGTFTNVHMIANVQWKESHTIHWNQSSKIINDTKKNVILWQWAYPELNCLNDGLITAFLSIMQYLPVLMFAKSPLIIASVWTMTLPFRTIFWEPQSIVWRLTLFPEVYFFRNYVKAQGNGNTILA